MERQCRFQWSRGLIRASAVSQFLGLRFRIPPWHGYLTIVSVCVVMADSLRPAGHSVVYERAIATFINCILLILMLYMKEVSHILLVVFY